MWKSILHLRPLASKFINGTVGNGQKISFWFDVWTPFGPLIEYMGSSGPALLGLPLHISVIQATRGSHWNVPHARSQQALNLLAYLTTCSPPSPAKPIDKYSWVVNGSICREFSTSLTWHAIRPRQSIKSWAPSVWFKGATPRNAFHMWVAQLDKLPTRSRLRLQGLDVVTTCMFCSYNEETRDHVLLTCPINFGIWVSALGKFRPPHQPFTSWTELLFWIRHSSSRAPCFL